MIMMMAAKGLDFVVVVVAAVDVAVVVAVAR